MKLKKMFNPSTIAVIGATNRIGSVGYAIMNNLVGSGFKGIVYPVNKTKKSVLGVRAYPSIEKVPDNIDLAIIATPAPTVPKIIEACGKKKVSGAVIISAGFKEVGKDDLCEQIVKLAKKHKMRLIGPNCLGFIIPKLKLNASFAARMALPGKVAFISQSGALGTAVLDWAIEQNVGFSNFISVGSMIDVSFHDLIDYFGEDPNTSAILIYMESLIASSLSVMSRTTPPTSVL